MPLSNLQKQLQKPSGKKVKLTINDNRSTMLSIKWEPDCTKVSLHRIFLEAPQNVMQALACYIRKEEKSISPSVKAYIEEGLRKLDYSHEIDLHSLQHQGKVYNLKTMYDTINNEYFDHKLCLNITWFGSQAQRNKSRITFGLYSDPLRLIKVNRLMDSRSFPDYVVSFIIYHEMLHHVCPAYVDEKGIHRVHNKEFKVKEAAFTDYNRAQDWIERHKAALFYD